MALNRSDKSRILRRYFPGMTRNSEMSTEPSLLLGGTVEEDVELVVPVAEVVAVSFLVYCRSAVDWVSDGDHGH